MIGGSLPVIQRLPRVIGGSLPVIQCLQRVIGGLLLIIQCLPRVIKPATLRSERHQGAFDGSR
jgi:hypothetical protein